MTDPAPEQIADGRSRARVATDRKIDQAVMRIVAEDGPAAVTIARVSDVSGVARTTLYRRYAASSEMLTDVAGRIAPLPTVDAAPDRDGFERIVGQLQHVFRTAGIVSLMGHVMVADAAFQSQWRTQFIGTRLAPLHRFLEQGMKTGALRPDLDADLIVELLVGSAVAQTALRGRLRDDWADRLVATLWPTIRAAGTPVSNSRPAPRD